MGPLDEELKYILIFQLTMDERIDGSLIDVDVRNGIASLKGTVQNSIAKRAAEEDAMTVLGINSVHNELILIHRY